MTCRVLAIDDSKTMRAMVESALSAEGFIVETAEDGRQGLDALVAFDPDVVVTDLNMPVLDGFGVLAGIRNSETHASTPVLFLSTEGGSELKKRAREGGATGWIIKPFDAAKLVAAIRRVAT